MSNNKYLDNTIPFFYRRQAIDLLIHAFITAYQDLFPSMTKKEAAECFMKKYGIAADLYDVAGIVKAYERTNTDLIHASKTEQRKG